MDYGHSGKGLGSQLHGHSENDAIFDAIYFLIQMCVTLTELEALTGEVTLIICLSVSDNLGGYPPLPNYDLN